MKNAFQRWLDGDIDLMEGISDAIPEHDHAREDIKERDRKIAREIDSRRETAILIARERKGLKRTYDGRSTAWRMSVRRLLPSAILSTVSRRPGQLISSPA